MEIIIPFMIRVKHFQVKYEGSEGEQKIEKGSRSERQNESIKINFF